MIGLLLTITAIVLSAGVAPMLGRIRLGSFSAWWRS
jgi:hypothetical protein